LTPSLRSIIFAALMNDRKLTTHVAPRRADTYCASRMNAPTHRCYFGGSNRCPCGKHRDPAGVSGIMADITPTGTPREHLAVEM
jgi:hypothetical protein